MAHSQVGKFVSLCGLLSVCVILSVAFYYQFIFKELPCPLCLLQRLGFVLIGFGFVMNIRFGVQVRHHGMVIAGAMMTAAVAARQTLLHIVPGNSGYGSTFGGLHFYTWSFIAASVFIMAVSFLMIVGQVFDTAISSTTSYPEKGVMVLFAILIVGNLVSVLLECGTGQCEGSPLHYRYLPFFR